MNLSGDDILEEIKHRFANKSNDFPRGGSLNYPNILEGWISNLDANALAYVTSGAIAIDGGGHLTMHDKEHVQRVRQVAADLIRKTETINLSSYEMVMLIIAIYLHDIGNILGRQGHEKSIGKVMKSGAGLDGLDSVEVRTAREIAGVHGGKVKGSKDTISTLPEISHVYGQNVRSRLLAAIVRLADELADDPARANRIQLITGTLPEQSEVFHVVAQALHTQMPEPNDRTITLLYSFDDPSLFKRKLGKLSGKVHLLDEIFERSVKAYNEARYCSRFTRPYLEFERVKVDIIIFDSDNRQLQSIKYCLAEQGYDDAKKSIYEMAPELAAFNGNGKLTPAYLKKLIAQAQSEEAA